MSMRQQAGNKMLIRESLFIPTYKNWKIWLNQLNPDFKWFIYFILFLPIINRTWNFTIPIFNIKFTEIAGVMIPSAILFILLKKKNTNRFTPLYKYFRYYRILVIINVFWMLLFYSFDFSSIILSIKYFIPLYLFFYFNEMIKNDTDFIGTLQTYYYSYFFIFIFFVMELIFGSQFIRETRGFVRSTAGFYDATNLSMSTIFALIIMTFTYFYMKKNKMKTRLTKTPYFLSSLFLFIFITYSTFQISSYVVLFCILILFSFFIFKIDKKLILYLSPLIPLMLSPISKMFNTFLIMANKDLLVLAGERSASTALHGRVNLWTDVYNQVTDMNLFQKLLGLNHSIYSSQTAHNDFIRVFMMIGLLGLLIYLLIFLKSLYFSYKASFAFKYLGLAVVFTTGLFSISSTPSFFTFSSIPIFCVISYLSTRHKIRYK